ncbi:hypothetical protein [Streptomyces axinellae]
MKTDADRELMRRAGIDAEVLDEGCCGMAGNFGFEKDHYELSMTVAEQGVLPAVRETADEALVIADGFSCRTQIEQGDTDRRALHLAEALARGLDGPAHGDSGGTDGTATRHTPSARALVTGAAGVATAVAALGAAYAAVRYGARRRRR